MIIGYITAMDDDKGLNNILMFSLSLKEDNDSLREYIILNPTGRNKTVALVMINYPRDEVYVESIVYDVSVYDGNHSAQSTVIVIGFKDLPTVSKFNVNRCGTTCIMLIILATITAVFLLPLFIFCYAARKCLKHLILTRIHQEDPIGQKADLKLGSHNSPQVGNTSVATAENADIRAGEVELCYLVSETKNIASAAKQASPKNENNVTVIIHSDHMHSMEYIYINAEQ